MVAPTPLTIPLDRVAAFCKKWSVQEFSLFGSVIRDDFGPESDVDILLVFEDGASPTLEPWIDMHEDLVAIFGRDVDVVEKRSLRNPFRRHHILTTRRLLYAA